jgi:hypothetical protein
MAGLCGLALATSASAQSAGQDAPQPPPPPPPAVADSICTDRPTKSNSPCTVPKGVFQYEAELVNASVMRLDGVTTDTTFLLNPTIKYGVSRDVDLQASLAALGIVHTRAAGSGAGQTLDGVGDLYLRVKYEFLDTPGGTLQASLLPYVKIPTARLGIGDGDGSGEGRHPNVSQTVSLGVDMGKNVTLYGELWGDWNFDPRGTVSQYSADGSLAFGISPRLQLDFGLNVGLNRYTPAAQVYVGVSQRF